jgi:pimeloyl-ACP methyl ester carboxylesterase
LVLVNPAVARSRPAALALLALTATPARALDFSPCAETGHEAFDCAILPVPIDRDGMVPGTIDLHVERQRGKEGRPVLVSVAGGPGYSSTAYRPKDDLQDLTDLGYDVQLVVVDQRGTGLSGALESVAPACRTLDSRRTLRACDDALGPAGAFYRTADSVLDLEAVRAALGAERLIVLGVSYGTFLAAEYARRFPDRVQALVLDSPVGPEGGEPLEVTSAHATARVLNALCRDGACAEITRDPAADTAALVRHSRAGPCARGPASLGSRGSGSSSGART